MSNDKYNQNLLIGAAVAAGILGTLTGLLGAKKNKRWSDQAKDIANQVLDSGEMVNKKMVLGGVAGGLVGAAAALLLAPKSGAELLKDIAKPFSHEEAHKRSSSHKTSSRQASSRKSASPKKSTSRSAKSGVARQAKSKAGEAKSSHAITKKAPSRRRTATAARVAAIHENEASETKEA